MSRTDFDDSTQLCSWVAEQEPAGPVCLLSFSCGKDSIAAWLKLRQHFKHVIPVYMYLVPGLEFVDRSLAYYEQFFRTRIMQLPHPSLYRWLDSCVMQAPQNVAVIEEAGLMTFDYDDVFSVVKATHRLPQETFTAIGVRATDSLNRWASIKKYGPVNHNRHTFYPTYDWRKDDLVAAIVEAGVQLPVDYQLFGRSFDGIDYRFLIKLREQFPDDYARILEVFPMAELEIKRMEYRQRYYDEEATL